MSKHANHSAKSITAAGKGMTLQEIRLQRAVTDMRIQIEKERLRATLLPGSTPGETALLTGIGRFETVLTYASLFVTAYRLAKKGVNLVKELKK